MNEQGIFVSKNFPRSFITIPILWNTIEGDICKIFDTVSLVIFSLTFVLYIQNVRKKRYAIIGKARLLMWIYVWILQCSWKYRKNITYYGLLSYTGYVYVFFFVLPEAIYTQNWRDFFSLDMFFFFKNVFIWAIKYIFISTYLSFLPNCIPLRYWLVIV